MTAETAVVLPAVVLVLVAVLSAGSAGVAQLRCSDAARVAARAAAIGEVDPVAAALAVAGVGADVSVSSADGWVHVVVSREVALPFGAEVTVVGRSAALDEPGDP